MLRNIRFYILLVSGLFSLAVYFWVNTSFSDSTVQIIRLTQVYALTSVFFLYVTLLAGPLLYVWPNLPFGKQYKHALRALGVSAFYFALLHSCFAFFGQLGGFGGLGYLGDKYLVAISLSFIALVILYILAITSFDFIIEKLTFRRWKILQRFVYLAGIFILIHALLLGTHFATLSEAIPQIFFSALSVLVFLEALRFDNFLRKKYNNLPQFGLSTSLVIGLILSFYIYSLLPTTTASPFSMHGQMPMNAGSQNMATTMNMNMSQYPGMDGDRTKRYTTSFLPPDAIESNQDTKLVFKVNDASTGKQVFYFKNLYTKPTHLIIVDSGLKYFTHIHPEPTDDGFIITTQFPKAGMYHLYLSFQPFGAVEQQVAFTVNVGQVSETEISTDKPDTNFTKSFGDVNVTLDTPQPLQAELLTSGQQRMKFTIRDSANNPVTTLKPYLAAFGHLVMINQKTYDYLHIHPADLIAPKPDENGGPSVEFLQLNMYGPIKPGIYRVFGQFNPNDKLFTADYTVEVK